MAIVKRIDAPLCQDKTKAEVCERSATSVVVGNDGKEVGKFCGGHAMKHLRLTARRCYLSASTVIEWRWINGRKFARCLKGVKALAPVAKAVAS